MRDITVGIVVMFAAVVFAAAIFSIGSEQRLWSPKVAYKIRLPNTNGLQVGSPVRLVGVQVGSITDITFPDDPNRNDIDIEMRVDASIQQRIRADTTASLKVLSVLGGEKFLELTPGSLSQPVIPPGSYLSVPQAIGIEQLQEIGAGIADDVAGITASLKVILDQLQDRETLLGQALFDPNFGRETLGNLKESMITTRNLLTRIESGEGLAGRLLTDRKFAETTLASLQGSLQHIESLLARVTDEKGPIHQALAPDGTLAASFRNVEESTGAMKDMVKGLRDGKGVASRLINDEAWANDVLANLRQTTAKLNSILDKVDRGTGTAGAFINDPGIYQDLRDVLRGVQESKFMSGMIRHYRKKGEKQRIEEQAEPQGQERGSREGL
jgi:phospholipid/cholesterol/gamma-HCH transport system substrate-binding protein